MLRVWRCEQQHRAIVASIDYDKKLSSHTIFVRGSRSTMAARRTSRQGRIKTRKRPAPRKSSLKGICACRRRRRGRDQALPTIELAYRSSFTNSLLEHAYGKGTWSHDQLLMRRGYLTRRGRGESKSATKKSSIVSETLSIIERSGAEAK